MLRIAAVTLAVPMVAALVVAGCAPRPGAERRVELLVFGSRAEIALRAANAAQADAALALVARRFTEFDSDWHAWRDSALTRFNAACAAGEPAQVPASIEHLVLRSQALAQASGGLFDPGMGALVRLWGFHTSDYPIRTPPPSTASIEAWRQAAPSVRQIDRLPDGRLRCRNPTIQLDFGAIAEGAALAVIAADLRAQGLRHALLNLGGDVLALGDAGGRPWRVAIRDPRGGVLVTVALADGESLFSSGSYAKFREHSDGSRWPHLLDPRSGQPVQHSLAASVIDRDPELADAAATALMVGGPAEFEALCAALGIRQALLLDAQGRLWLSPALQARLQLAITAGQ